MTKKSNLFKTVVIAGSLIILLSPNNIFASNVAYYNKDKTKIEILSQDSKLNIQNKLNKNSILLNSSYKLLKNKDNFVLANNSKTNLNNQLNKNKDINIKSLDTLDLTIDKIKIGENIEYYNKILTLEAKEDKINDFSIYSLLEDNYKSYTAILAKDSKIEAIFTTQNILKDYNIKDKDNIDNIKTHLKDKIILQDSKYKELIGKNILLKNYNDKLSLEIDGKRIDVYYDKHDNNQILGFYIYKNNSEKYLNKPKFKDLNLSDEELKTISKQTINLINILRRSKGLDILQWSEKLEDVAKTYSEYSIKNNHYGHVDKEGLDSLQRLNKKGYKATYVGENILKYPNIVPLPIDILNSYIHSEGHRRNILNPEYKYYGTGISYGNQEVHNTQMFSKEIN